MVSYLYTQDPKLAGNAEACNLALLRSYRPLRCRAHFLDTRPIVGHGPIQCIGLRCRLSSPGCLLMNTSIMGLLVPPLIVLVQLSRSGLSAERRGSLRTLVEVNACPGYRRQALNSFLPWSLSALDQNALVRATSGAIRPLVGEQLIHSVHPVLPTPGSSVRIIFPDYAKIPTSEVKF